MKLIQATSIINSFSLPKDKTYIYIGGDYRADTLNKVLDKLRNLDVTVILQSEFSDAKNINLTQKQNVVFSNLNSIDLADFVLFLFDNGSDYGILKLLDLGSILHHDVLIYTDPGLNYSWYIESFTIVHGNHFYKDLNRCLCDLTYRIMQRQTEEVVE
jgi:hypothetical protein